MKTMAAVATLNEQRKTDWVFYLATALLGVSIALFNNIPVEEHVTHPLNPYFSKIIARMDITYNRLVEWETMDIIR